MSSDSDLVGEQSAYWSKLRHIGAHEGDFALRPELEELGVDEVHRICTRVWIYSRADFEPDPFVELASSQWRETCALAGSMAESLMLTAATYIECVWHERATAAQVEPSGMAIAQRFLADTAVDTVVSVGHRLINFVARVARTDPVACDAFSQDRRLKALGKSYTPFVTVDRRAWLSLNKDEMASLRAAVPERHGGSLDALDTLAASTEWQAVADIRAENFHRWRREHESVHGVDEHSGYGSDILDNDGNHIGRRIGARSRRHTGSDGLTEKTTQAAGNGMHAVAKAIDAVLDDTLRVLPQIARGYRLEISSDGASRTIWPLMG
ncbi:hypothetical protein JNN96_38040 [Mycobacterium sp. DSM 3803]|nr:hypothetical protein [Mycobacterium sp. DSM 3803]